ncbi:MAG: nucleotide sugar dehydrogenase [Crenarchaeota archaeon]|nr:nucleotide sugar dehydrogenase [Thermoproteota archaeon]
MRVAVVGLGYVGLPLAVALASKGFEVIGIDIDEEKVKKVNEGVPPIEEPGLPEMLAEVVERKKLRATTNYDEIKNVDAIIIAVPTPVKEGKADLSFLESALTEIGKRLRRGQLVIIESTIPPGTTQGLAKEVLERVSGLRHGEFKLAHAPERLAPGKAMTELFTVTKLVGGVTPEDAEAAAELYRKLTSGGVITTSAINAEMSKLAENTYRDLNIAFANALAILAEKLGADVWEVIRLANTHPRVNVHLPGPGVGGPCLTKDPYMLAYPMEGLPRDLIIIGRKINESMPQHFAELVRELAEPGSKVALLGLAYKGGVDDIRESPTLKIYELLKDDYEVSVHDPYVKQSPIPFTNDLEEAVKGASLIAVVTDHPDYKELDWEKLAGLVKEKKVLDGRKIINKEEAVKHGFEYRALGVGL